MYKRLGFVLIVCVLAAGPVVGSVAAQGATPIELGQWVEGALTDESFENLFTFTASAGDLIMVEMTQKPGTFDLDPFIILLDSQNRTVAENDDFEYPFALVLADITANGDYTIVATRTDGRTGDSQGEYVLRATRVEPLTAGAKVEVKLNDDSVDDVNDLSQHFVLAPAENGPVQIGFRQEIGELFGSVALLEYDPTSVYSGSTIMGIDNSARISSASFTLELEGGKFYVLSVGKSFYSFSFDNPEATVTVTIN